MSSAELHTLLSVCGWSVDQLRPDTFQSWYYHQSSEFWFEVAALSAGVTIKMMLTAQITVDTLLPRKLFAGLFKPSG